MRSEKSRRASLLIAEDPEELARLAASLFIKDGEEILSRKPWFDVVLSGGSTPRKTYEILASVHRDSLDWKKVRFFWGDERMVPPDHPQSNYRMASEALLAPLAIPEVNIFRFQSESGTAAEVAARYEKKLLDLFGEPRFDFLFLGIGEDGHTASLFPDAWEEWSELEAHGHWVAAPRIPHLGQFRLTLLPRALNQSSKTVFLVSGASKQEILEEVLNWAPGEKPRFPAQLIHIRPDEGSGSRPLWLADRTAAARLSQAA